MLRRIKAEVETSLLPKQEFVLKVPLTPLQRKWYQRMLSRDVAMLFSAFQVRLYRLASEIIDNKLTSAPWPTWGSALLHLTEATLSLQRRALYRTNKAR